MGVNDNLIEDYRNVITNQLLSNKLIVDIIGNGKYGVNNENLISSDDLLWQKVFPSQFVPYTVTDTDTYIFYDIEESASTTNTSYVTLNIVFWLITHKDFQKYNGKLRLDILSRELKNIMRQNCELGLSKNHFIYNKLLSTGLYDYTGRTIAFSVTDFNDKLRYGEVK